MCKHYWKIEDPNGPTSKGVCKYCGEIREFHNKATDSAWTRFMKVERSIADAARTR